MDLLNQTLNSFSTQISDGGVSFNGDIFEANLVNLVLLDGGIFYLLSGALSAAGCTGPQKAQHGNAVTFLVIKIGAFTSIKDFRKRVSNLISHVKNTRLQKGFRKILIPGDFERINRSKNLKRGVTINHVTLNEIKKLLIKKKIKFNI